MTPPVLITTSVPDLREVPYGEPVSPEDVEKVLQRVLPGRRRVVSVAGFSSSL